MLRGVDLVVDPGTVGCLVGPSGSGKTTLLHCLNRLERVDAGSIRVGPDLIGYRRRGDRLHELTESALAAQRRHIGMVFQRFNLFPHLTAAQNVAEAPVHVLRVPRRAPPSCPEGSSGSPSRGRWPWTPR